MSTQFTFYCNAFVTIEDETTRLVFDPWTTPGILDSGWYPPFQISDDHFEDAKETYYLASHPHPDHFDIDFLLAQHRPIYIPEFNANASAMLTGKSDMRLLTPWDFQQIGPFEVTCTNAFNGPDFDSTFLVKHANMTYVLGSDNSPKALDGIKRCQTALNGVSLAALNYSRADGHPGMFHNLTREQMLQVRKNKLETTFQIMVEALKILQPKYVLPYAGDYELRSEKQDIKPLLGLCSPEEVIEYLRNELPSTEILNPSHGARWSFDNDGKLQETESIADTLVLSDPVPSSTWYEGDLVPRHVIRKLKKLIETATPKLLKRIPDGKYDSFVIQARELDTCFHIDLRDGLVLQKSVSDEASGNFVRAKLDLNYLIHLMTGFCDWNSAQNGLHTEWYRKDDIYDGAFYSGLYDFKATKFENTSWL